MLKAREICHKTAPNIPYTMIISYILDKGESNIRKITDNQINEIKGNDMMTADFIKTLVYTAREVVRNCDQNDIIRLIKSEWCCSGEVYDPDLDQFVNDVNANEDY